MAPVLLGHLCARATCTFLSRLLVSLIVHNLLFNQLKMDLTRYNHDRRPDFNYARAGRAAYDAYRRYGPSVRRAFNTWRSSPSSSSSPRQATKRRRTVSTEAPRRPRGSTKGARLPPGHRSIRGQRGKPIGPEAGKALSLEQITDMLCPLVKEEYQQSHTELTWNANKQGVRMMDHLVHSKLKEMWDKMRSADVDNLTNTKALSGSDWGASSTLRFTAGYVEYSVVNISNHTISVQFESFKAKRRCNYNPKTCAEWDLLKDDTLANTVAPINVEKDIEDYGASLHQPNNPASMLRFNYKSIKKMQITLAVGESFTYKVESSPFTMDPSRENLFSHGTSPFTYGPAYVGTVITCQSQLVVDGTGAQIAHGSGKVGIAEKFVQYMRGGIGQKRYQTFNHGALDDISSVDQFHYNVDTEAETIYTQA